MSDEVMDWLTGGGGAPTATFPEKGSQILGRVVAYEMVQQRDFKTQKGLTFDDGSPRMQPCITIQTEDFTAVDENDDGKRRLFVKYGNMRDALKDAIAASGHAGSLIGGLLWMQCTGQEAPTQPGLNGAKTYRAKFEPPSQTDLGPDPEPEPEHVPVEDLGEEPF